MKNIIISLSFLTSVTLCSRAQAESKLDSLYQLEEYLEVIKVLDETKNRLSTYDSFLIARSYMQLGLNEKASGLFSSLSDHHPDKINYLIHNLAVSSKLQSHTYVYIKSKGAIDNGKSSPALYKYLINAADKINCKEDAFLYAFKGWEKYPNDPTLAYHYVLKLQEINLYDSSLKVLNPILAIDSSQYFLLEKAVKANYKMRNYAAVINLANYPLSKEIYLSNVLLFALDSYYKLQQYKEAISLMDQLLKNKEYSTTMLLIGAKAAAADGNYTLSNQWLIQGWEELADEQGLSFLHQLASNATKQQKYSEAKKYYDTAQYIYNKPYTHYLKGSNFLLSNQKISAKKEFLAYKKIILEQNDTTRETMAILKYIEDAIREK